jgi:hypothetical protein
MRRFRPDRPPLRLGAAPLGVAPHLTLVLPGLRRGAERAGLYEASTPSRMRALLRRSGLPSPGSRTLRFRPASRRLWNAPPANGTDALQPT